MSQRAGPAAEDPGAAADTEPDYDTLASNNVANVLTARRTAKRLFRKKTRAWAKRQAKSTSEDYEPWPEDRRIDFVLVYKPVKKSTPHADDVEPNPRPNDADDQAAAKDESAKKSEEARLRVEYIETLWLNGLEIEIENFTSLGMEYRVIKVSAMTEAMDEMAEKFLLMKPVCPPSGSVFKKDEQDTQVDKLIAIYNETLYRLPKMIEDEVEEAKDLFDSDGYVPQSLKNMMNTVVGKFKKTADDQIKKTKAEETYKRDKIRTYKESEAFKQLQFLTDRYNTFWSVKVGNWFFNLLHGHDPRLNLMHDTFITRAIRAPFNLLKKEKFLGYGGLEFYNSSERSRMVHRILENPGRKLSHKDTTLKLQDMYSRGCFEAAFPLHAGDYKIGGENTKWQDLNNLGMIDNPRKLLLYFWSSSHMKYKYQPINIVRNYFGAITAMYFAYSGFYNMALFGPAIVGTGVFIYGLFQMFFNVMVKEICESGKTYKMCSECHMAGTCDITYLSDYCFTTKVTSAANNGAVIVFSVAMMVWLALFVTFWKRRQNTIAHVWGTTHSKAASAELRVKYTLTKTNVFRFNTAAGRRERHVTFWNRLPQYTIAFSVVAMFLTAALLMTLTITVYKYSLSVTIHRSGSEFYKKYANEIAVCITGSISGLLIICLSFVYQKVAVKLTDLENHRTQRDHENHLTFKIYIFDFVNYYGTLFYIAFLKGNITSPKKTDKLFDYDQLQLEGCAPGGCMSEVAIQMIMIMSIKQLVPILKDVIRTLNLVRVQEQLKRLLLRPFTWIGAARRARARSKKYLAGMLEHRKQFIKDFELREPTEMYQEYVNIVIQLGFLTMFVTALPIAPLICLIINFWLLRNDATRYVKRVRRTVGFRAEGIGTWMNILEFLCRIAILVNAGLIAFTFDFLPNVVYQTTVSENNSLTGYVDFMLATHTFINVNNQNTTCRFWSYMTPASVEHSDFWLTLMVVRMLFVFLFQNLVWALVTAIELVIDSTPKTVKERMVLENKISQEWLSSDDNASEDEDSSKTESTKKNGRANKDTTIHVDDDDDTIREDEVLARDTNPLT